MRVGGIYYYGFLGKFMGGAVSMSRSTLALGLVLGCFAFGVSGVASMALAGEHPEHPAPSKETCSACKTEVKKGELVCPDCGGVLKDKDGKKSCDSKKCAKDGKPVEKAGSMCKSCYDAKHKDAPEE
jgi:hypothetical protein